jgi:CheY-like chemotaxis protein
VYVDSILERETGFSDRTRKQLEIVRRAVDDVARTVARMGEFYRKKPAQLELAPVPVERVLREVLELTRARWNDMAQQRGAFIETSIESRADSTGSSPTVMGIENELREALINLVLNAIDAMPEGGRLVLRTGTSESRVGRVFIEVIDTGSGMNEDTRRRCLEPFFTTKGERGSGLGLAMVYGIAQRHEIQIDIASAPRAGTTVRLIFPKGPPSRPATGPAVQKSPRKTRILLVDDDPLLLASLSDVLISEGHEVHAASGGKEGIDAFLAAHEAGRPFPVVLTDLGMPHVDGRAVAAAIAELAPTTPVIMLTGWGQRLVSSGDIPPHVVAVLGKPPNLAELRRKLAECVGDLTEIDST